MEFSELEVHLIFVVVLVVLFGLVFTINFLHRKQAKSEVLTFLEPSYELLS